MTCGTNLPVSEKTKFALRRRGPAEAPRQAPKHGAAKFLARQRIVFLLLTASTTFLRPKKPSKTASRAANKICQATADYFAPR